MATDSVSADTGGTIEIVAFLSGSQTFGVPTRSIREIRGWSPATPIPHAPPEVMGVINLRGLVIPIVDLARKLGLPASDVDERSAIVVTDVHDKVFGLVVQRVSDILSADKTQIKPVPELMGTIDRTFTSGIIATEEATICLLDLDEMLGGNDLGALAA